MDPNENESVSKNQRTKSNSKKKSKGKKNKNSNKNTVKSKNKKNSTNNSVMASKSQASDSSKPGIADPQSSNVAGNSSHTSPPTPKPLDYRSESKRRAADNEHTGDTRVENWSESNKTNSRKKRDRNGFGNNRKPDESEHRNRDFESVSYSRRPGYLLSTPSGSQVNTPCTSQQGPYTNWFQSINSYKSWERNVPPFYREASTSQQNTLYKNQSTSNKIWNQCSRGPYLEGASNWYADDAVPRNCWQYNSFVNQQPPAHDYQYFGNRGPNYYNWKNDPRNFYPGNNFHNKFNRSPLRQGRDNRNHQDSNVSSKSEADKVDNSKQVNVPSHDKNSHSQGFKRLNSFSKGARGKIFLPMTRSIINASKIVKSKRFDFKRPQSTGNIMFDSTLSRFSRLSLRKKNAIKNIVEDSKKKALTSAGSKLRKSFLASRKPTSDEGNSDDQSQDVDSDFGYQENAEDLSINKANERRALGEQEGSRSSTSGNSSSSHNNEQYHSNLDEGLQDISEDEEEDEDMDEDEENESENGVTPRRRHMSETAGAVYPKILCAPRSRSTSVGCIIDADYQRNFQPKAKSVQPGVDKMLVKQLLTMDKKSLKELVNDPRSRKAQFMVSHLMAEQRSALSQRLDELRAQTSLQPSHSNEDDFEEGRDNHLDSLPQLQTHQEEELQILGHLEALKLASLSTDVLQQVRMILSVEEAGAKYPVMPHVSVSIDELMSGNIEQQHDLASPAAVSDQMCHSSNAAPASSSSVQPLNLEQKTIILAPQELAVPSQNLASMSNDHHQTESSDDVGTDLRTEKAKERSSSQESVNSSMSVPIFSENTKPKMEHSNQDVADQQVERILNKSCSSDMECQIVSPPPKQPPTTITIDDSDTEEIKHLTKNINFHVLGNKHVPNSADATKAHVFSPISKPLVPPSNDEQPEVMSPENVASDVPPTIVESCSSIEQKQESMTPRPVSEASSSITSTSSSYSVSSLIGADSSSVPMTEVDTSIASTSTCVIVTQALSAQSDNKPLIAVKTSSNSPEQQASLPSHHHILPGATSQVPTKTSPHSSPPTTFISPPPVKSSPPPTSILAPSTEESPTSCMMIQPPLHFIPPAPIQRLNDVLHANLNLNHIRNLDPVPPPNLAINSNLDSIRNLSNSLGMDSLGTARRIHPPAPLERMNQQRQSPPLPPNTMTPLPLHPPRPVPPPPPHHQGSSSSSLNVKEERATPHSECHLCQHLPHSPQSPQHTPQCCPYTPTPVDPPPSVPPRPPPPMPPSRSPPSQSSPPNNSAPSGSLMGLFARPLAKHDQMPAPYLKCENVNRPSSEERPRNPAPPLAPVPPPVPLTVRIVPNPRTVLFSPEPEIPERPPPPMPHHMSPRIKLERHTPTQQYQCCCLRNECNRSVSRYSTDSTASRSLNTVNHSIPSGASGTANTSSHVPMTGLHHPNTRMWYYNVPPATNNTAALPSTMSHPSMMEPPHDQQHPHHHSLQQHPRILKKERLTPFVERNGHTSSAWSNERRPDDSISLNCPTTETSTCTNVRSEENNVSCVSVAVQTHSNRSPVYEHESDLHDEIDRDVQLTDDRAATSEVTEHNMAEEVLHPSFRLSSKTPTTRSCQTSRVTKSRATLPIASTSSSTVPNCNFGNISHRSSFEAIDELSRLSTLESILLKDLHKLDEAAQEIERQRRSLSKQLSDLHTSRNDCMTRLISMENITARAHHGRRSVPVMPILFNLETLHRTRANDGAESMEDSFVSSSQEMRSNGNGHTISSSLEKNDGGNGGEKTVQRQRCTSTSHSPSHSIRQSRISPSLPGPLQFIHHEEHSSDSEDSVQREPVGTIMPQLSAGASTLDNKDSSNYLSSSAEDITNLDVRITRRRSKSLCENIDDLNISKDEDKGNPLCTVSIPDTTDNETDDNPCIVEELSETNAAEFNVSHSKEFSVHNMSSDSVQQQQQTSASELPQKLFSSSQSPKSRNSSGSDHSYSLRSRGPPEANRSVRRRAAADPKECLTPDEILSAETSSSSTVELDKDVIEDDGTDEELVDEDDRSSQCLSAASSVESSDSKSVGENQRHKRKRKTRKHSCPVIQKRRKTANNCSPDKKISVVTSPPTRRKTVDSEGGGINKRQRQTQNKKVKCELEEMIIPPVHKEAVLDMKVSGDYMFTCSGNTVQCFKLTTGKLVTAYSAAPQHSGKLTAMCIAGRPDSGEEDQPSDTVEFEVVTGANDGTVCVFNGETGCLDASGSANAVVRCVAISWGQVFVATDTGAVLRWSYKSSGGSSSVMTSVEGCVGGVSFLVCHKEGPRKVLVMGGRQSPIIVRDAFSGLFLRSLSVVQTAVYRALFMGGQLFTAGSRSIVHYDYASGEDRGRSNTDSDVCSLALSSQYLLAVCYDATVRVYSRETGALLHKLKVDPCNKLLLCSAVYKHKVLLGNKAGEIISIDLP